MCKSMFYIAIFLAFIFISCQSKSNESIAFDVKHSGALRTIMSGNISSTISLDSLAKTDHLFALGAVENLKGEIQIFDGNPVNSFVVDDAIKTGNSYDINATLLVYTHVKEWNIFQINNSHTKSELEAKIFELAKSNNIDIENPFPFLIEGKISSLDWHVIDWEEGDTNHSHKKHTTSGLNGTLEDRNVVILGFYSTKHKTIFTHHTTDMHMHFKTVDNTLAGHVDDVKVSSIEIKLPKQENNSIKY